MAVLNFCGFETGDSAEAQSVTGTNSIVTSPVHGAGVYALRVNPTTSAVGNYRFASMSAAGVATTSMNVATLYQRFYFYITTAPSADREEILVILDTGGSQKAAICLNSSRQLEFYNNADSLIATGTTALSTSTWYRLEVKTSTGSGSTAYEVKIDGTSELSGTANTLTNNHGSIRLGKGTNRNSRSIDVYYDDWIADDAAYPGDGQCARLAPTANGSTQQFTAGTNSSNYLEVDEVPTDGDTTYIASSGSANQTALMDCAAMPSAASINAVKTWVRSRSASGASSTKVRIKSSATTSDTTAADYTTSYVNRFKLSTVDPNTSAAWAEAAVNAAEFGLVEANAIVNRCTSISGFVDYVASSGVTGTIAVTTGNITSTSTATETFTGTIAVTTGNIASASTATETFTGTISATLGNVASTSAATETFSGTIARTLGDTTASIAGSETFSGAIGVTTGEISSAIVATSFGGSIAVTTGNIAASISATETFSGTIGVTCGNTTMTATAELVANVSTLAVTTGNIAAAISAIETFSGSISRTLDNVAGAGSAAETFTSSINVTIDNVGAAIVASVGANGTISVTTNNISSSIVAVETFTGAIVATCGNTTSSISATVTQNNTGTIAVTTGNVSSAIVATETFSGSIGVTLGNVTSAASATETNAATISVTCGDITASISASLTIQAAINDTIANITASIAAIETFSGSINSSLGDVTCSASATQFVVVVYEPMTTVGAGARKSLEGSYKGLISGGQKR